MALLGGEHFVSCNREHRVLKNREFYADFKNTTCLSDKIPLQKVKIKKKLPNFAKPIFLRFTFLTLFGVFC
jgi:hypothetical protein